MAVVMQTMPEQTVWTATGIMPLPMASFFRVWPTAVSVQMQILIDLGISKPVRITTIARAAGALRQSLAMSAVVSASKEQTAKRAGVARS